MVLSRAPKLCVLVCACMHALLLIPGEGPPPPPCSALVLLPPLHPSCPSFWALWGGGLAVCGGGHSNT